MNGTKGDRGGGYQGNRGGTRPGKAQDHRKEEGLIVDTISAKVEELNSLSDFPVDDLVKYAEDMGKYLTQINLKTNQIRKFLDAVKKLDSLRSTRGFNRDEVKLLKPKLAYAAGRQSQVVKPLMAVLGPCIDKTGSEEDFKILVRFIESIVAYHKYYDGRD